MADRALSSEKSGPLWLKSDYEHFREGCNMLFCHCRTIMIGGLGSRLERDVSAPII